LLDLNETTSLKLDLPFTLPAKTEPVCILHCRGMICLTLNNSELAIWKIGSEEFMRIPMVEPGQPTNLLGFGYDRLSDDYKIVMIISSKTYIYALKGGIWRESVPNTSLHCKFKDPTGRVVEHCMYDSRPVSQQKPTKENHHPVDKKIMQWNIDLWIYMKDNVKGFKKFDVGLACLARNEKFDVGFACIARNDELFIVVKGNGKGEDKLLVYNEMREKFTEVPLIGNSLKGFRCMTI
ncbi:PREDICTED: LOW QUALITY PROTEIN: uncharacterized protein LOC104787662, partial [Camelina sativa]|uniref:LOW QUALITY PROTEIN: uncharacterized protein LOC104787662 n=1 Tax=Camelina sativa TaxID=90675 RepID=A0ABM0Z7N4_CAMSA